MQNLASALAEFHQEVGPILKQSDAQYGKYADLATVLAVVTPVLSDKGLVLTQTFMPFEPSAILRTTLLHTSGESINSDLPMPALDGARNALHAFGGATTYLRRYALLAILNLAAEDDDGDSWDREKAKDAKTVSESGTGTQRQPHKRVPAASPNPPRLTDQAKKELVASIQAMEPSTIAQLAEAFRAQFRLASDVKVSEYIKTQLHSDFINDWIKQHAPEPVAA